MGEVRTEVGKPHRSPSGLSRYSELGSRVLIQGVQLNRIQIEE